MPVSSQAPYQPASEGRQAIMAQLAAISKVPLVTTSLPPKRASGLATNGESSGHHQHRKRQAEIQICGKDHPLSAAIAPAKVPGI